MSWPGPTKTRQMKLWSYEICWISSWNLPDFMHLVKSTRFHHEMHWISCTQWNQADFMMPKEPRTDSPILSLTFDKRHSHLIPFKKYFSSDFICTIINRYHVPKSLLSANHYIIFSRSSTEDPMGTLAKEHAWLSLSSMHLSAAVANSQ